MNYILFFEEENVVHVEGRIDPIDDIDVIETELILSDLESVERQVPRLQKRARGGEKEAQELLKLFEQLSPVKVVRKA